MLTKKHFKSLATILKNTNANCETIKMIGDMCAKDNPKFDYDKFYNVCGINGNI